jgi:hypothetical protein
MAEWMFGFIVTGIRAARVADFVRGRSILRCDMALPAVMGMAGVIV